MVDKLRRFTVAGEGRGWGESNADPAVPETALLLKVTPLSATLIGKW